MSVSKPIYLFSVSTHPEAKNINSLDITYFHPEIHFKNYDYFIITSKQAVEALKYYDKDSFLDKKALCISIASAKNYESIGGNVLESAEGYGDDLCRIIKKYPQDTKWLYLRAESISSKFASKSRAEGFCIDEKIVYKTQCSQDILEVKPEEKSIFIFTSPSGIECFLKNSDIPVNAEVIVIGKTTARALPKNQTYRLSPARTVESCIEIAKTL